MALDNWRGGASIYRTTCTSYSPNLSASWWYGSAWRRLLWFCMHGSSVASTEYCKIAAKRYVLFMFRVCLRLLVMCNGSERLGTAFVFVWICIRRLPVGSKVTPLGRGVNFLFMLLAPSLAMLSQFFVSQMGSNHAPMLYRAGDRTFGQFMFFPAACGGQTPEGTLS